MKYFFANCAKFSYLKIAKQCDFQITNKVKGEEPLPNKKKEALDYQPYMGRGTSS